MFTAPFSSAVYFIDACTRLFCWGLITARNFISAAFTRLVSYQAPAPQFALLSLPRGGKTEHPCKDKPRQVELNGV